VVESGQAQTFLDCICIVHLWSDRPNHVWTGQYFGKTC